MCHSRESYYFDEHGKRHLIGDYCTGGLAPLSLRSGELLSLRTARAAKRVDLMPLDSLGDFESGDGVGSCRLRYRGVWACRMPRAPAGDGYLEMSIAYPKARGNWRADIRVQAQSG